MTSSARECMENSWVVKSLSSFGIFLTSGLLLLTFRCVEKVVLLVNQVSLPRTGSLHVLQYSPPKVTIKTQAALFAALAALAAFPTAAAAGEGVTSTAFAVVDAAGVLALVAAILDWREAAGEASAAPGNTSSAPSSSSSKLNSYSSSSSGSIWTAEDGESAGASWAAAIAPFMSLGGGVGANGAAEGRASVGVLAELFAAAVGVR